MRRPTSLQLPVYGRASDYSAHAALSYDKWFREQAQEALDDPRPNVAHAQVQQEMSDKKAALRKRLAAAKDGRR